MPSTPPKNPLSRLCTPAELAKVSDVLIDEENIRLACISCGREWSPLLGRKGRLPRGYWKCREGCHEQS